MKRLKQRHGFLEPNIPVQTTDIGRCLLKEKASPWLTLAAAGHGGAHRLLWCVNWVVQDVIHGALFVVGPAGLLMRVAILRFIPPVEVHNLNK